MPFAAADETPSPKTRGAVDRSIRTLHGQTPRITRSSGRKQDRVRRVPRRDYSSLYPISLISPPSHAAVAFEPSLEAILSDPTHVTDEMETRYHELNLRAGTREATLAHFEVPIADARIDRIGELPQPTLILWGGEDRRAPVRDAERFATAIPNSRLYVYDKKLDPARYAARGPAFPLMSQAPPPNKVSARRTRAQGPRAGTARVK